MSDRAPIVVKVKGAEATNLIKLTFCANLENPDFRRNKEGGETCVAAMEEAALNGWAKNLPSVILALRQVAFTNPEGEDNPAAFAQYITEAAVSAKPGQAVVDFCKPKGITKIGDAPCNSKPITDDELAFTIRAGNPKLTPDMNPRRMIPIPASHAAANGFFDALMTPDRFLLAEDGSNKTLSQAATDIRQKTSTPALREKVVTCMTNTSLNPKVNPKDCALDAARYGLVFQVENGLSYDGSKFLGQKPTAGIAPRK